MFLLLSCLWVSQTIKISMLIVSWTSNVVHLFQVYVCECWLFIFSAYQSFSILTHCHSTLFCFVEVIWGQASNEVAVAAHEDLTAVKNELQNNQTKRWQAFGMLKHILASVTLPWELKKHAIDFLHSIRGGNISPCDEHSDFSTDMPGLFAALQVVSLYHYIFIFFLIKNENNLICFISFMLHFRLFKWSSCIQQTQS